MKLEDFKQALGGAVLAPKSIEGDLSVTSYDFDTSKGASTFVAYRESDGEVLYLNVAGGENQSWVTYINAELVEEYNMVVDAVLAVANGFMPVGESFALEVVGRLVAEYQSTHWAKKPTVTEQSSQIHQGDEMQLNEYARITGMKDVVISGYDTESSDEHDIGIFSNNVSDEDDLLIGSSVVVYDQNYDVKILAVYDLRTNLNLVWHNPSAPEVFKQGMEHAFDDDSFKQTDLESVVKSIKELYE